MYIYLCLHVKIQVDCENMLEDFDIKWFHTEPKKNKAHTEVHDFFNRQYILNEKKYF